MDQRTRVALAVVATVALFLAVQLGALALAPEFQQRPGTQVTDNPEDPSNSVGYVGLMLVATAGMLVLIKLGAEQVIKGVVLLTSGFLSYFVISTVLSKALGGAVSPGTAGLVGLAGGAGVFLALLLHPEWYVIDAAGVLMGAGAAGLFGINFGVLPALVLLVVLAVYDAISVYGTEHMLTLAEGVMDLRIPVLLVVPTTLSFSMDDLADAPVESDGGDAAGENADGGDGNQDASDHRNPDGAPDTETPLVRDALFIGLGDAVIPAVLVVSAGFFLQRRAAPFVDGFVLNLPALGAMVGTTAGLLGLLYLVLRGRPHAGLPLLNGGAITGYLVGAVAAGVPLAVALGL